MTSSGTVSTSSPVKSGLYFEPSVAFSWHPHPHPHLCTHPLRNPRRCPPCLCRSRPADTYVVASAVPPSFVIASYQELPTYRALFQTLHRKLSSFSFHIRQPVHPAHTHSSSNLPKFRCPVPFKFFSLVFFFFCYWLTVAFLSRHGKRTVLIGRCSKPSLTPQISISPAFRIRNSSRQVRIAAV